MPFSLKVLFIQKMEALIRLPHSLRTPGINMIERVVLQQRAANMTADQGYVPFFFKILVRFGENKLIYRSMTYQLV